jgi:glycosyltransferase involved in cell wall biosynthesis
MSEPAFSVILCTRNRAHLLGDALRSLLTLDHPSYEVLIVDNGSTDATQEVFQDVARSARAPWRIVYEARPGLSVARNRGIREARGRWVVFTDDDQVVDPALLREFERVATAHAARVLQGNIELDFPGGRPAWLKGKLADILGKTKDVPEGPADIELYGGNMCFERSLFETVTGFREDLGKGASGYSEDIEMARRIRAAGERVVYAPGAIVRHVILPDRANVSFFRQNSYQKGFSDGRGASPLQAVQYVAGAVFRVALNTGLALAAAPVNQHVSVLAQTRAANSAGRFIGALTRGRRRGAA